MAFPGRCCPRKAELETQQYTNPMPRATQEHWALGFAYLPGGGSRSLPAGEAQSRVVMGGGAEASRDEDVVLEGEAQVSLETSALMASGCQHEGKSVLPPWVHVHRTIVQSLGPLPTPDSTWPLQVTQVDQNQVLLGDQGREHHSSSLAPSSDAQGPCSISRLQAL